MKKVAVIFVLNLFLGTCIFSQDISVGFRTGVGTYSMSGLKSINDAVFTPFDSELVSDFPPYFYYQPIVLMKWVKYNIGLAYTFQSTGSRISAKDYSGEYRFDMKVNSSNLGIYNAMNLFSRNKFQLLIYANLGMTFSSLKINQYFNLLDTVITNETSRFKALNYYVEPGIDIKYFLTPYINIGANLGYYIQFGDQAFHLAKHKENELINPVNQKLVKPEWNGFRFGISFMFNISHEVKLK